MLFFDPLSEFLQFFSLLSNREFGGSRNSFREYSQRAGVTATCLKSTHTVFEGYPRRVWEPSSGEEKTQWTVEHALGAFWEMTLWISHGFVPGKGAKGIVIEVKSRAGPLACSEGRGLRLSLSLASVSPYGEANLKRFGRYPQSTLAEG